jgi:hypothetical protein
MGEPRGPETTVGGHPRHRDGGRPRPDPHQQRRRGDPARHSQRGHRPYDGATWTAASDVDIDHVVPLKNAWISGASSWTTTKRESFANDLTRPQLIAVTDNVNQSKSDKSPDVWKPPLTSYHCT